MFLMIMLVGFLLSISITESQQDAQIMDGKYQKLKKHVQDNLESVLKELKTDCPILHIECENPTILREELGNILLKIVINDLPLFKTPVKENGGDTRFLQKLVGEVVSDPQVNKLHEELFQQPMQPGSKPGTIGADQLIADFVKMLLDYTP